MANIVYKLHNATLCLRVSRALLRSNDLVREKKKNQLFVDSPRASVAGFQMGFFSSIYYTKKTLRIIEYMCMEDMEGA